jgi:hypothetical protein
MTLISRSGSQLLIRQKNSINSASVADLLVGGTSDIFPRQMLETIHKSGVSVNKTQDVADVVLRNGIENRIVDFIRLAQIFKRPTFVRALSFENKMPVFFG